MECDIKPEIMETPIDIAKKKLNFSENKTMEGKPSGKDDREKCICDNNANLYQSEFDIDQAKRKLSFNSTRKGESKTMGSSGTSSAGEMCHQCFKQKSSMCDTESPGFLPVNVDTPEVKCEPVSSCLKLRIENVASVSENVDLSDTSDKGYQSDDDIFVYEDNDDQILYNVNDTECTLPESEDSKKLSGKIETKRGFSGNGISKHTPQRAKRVKDETIGSSQKSQATPKRGVKKSQNICKDENQPSIFSYFSKKSRDQSKRDSSLPVVNGVSSGDTNPKMLMSGRSQIASTSVSDGKGKCSKSKRNILESKVEESHILTYKFISNTSTEDSKVSSYDKVDCDSVDHDASQQIPEKLRKKSLTENVTSLLSGAINKTRSAIGLLKQTSEAKPWSLKPSRTSKAGGSSASQVGLK